MPGSIKIFLAVLLITASAINADTPAEQKIALARKTISNGKAAEQAYNDLAMAFARRARETGDPHYYDEANRALADSFRIAPDNFEGQKVRVWTLLGKHQFADAAREAKALNKRVPDDVMVYAMLVDAHAELGDYAEAEKAAQWFLDLRPGLVAGLTRAAYLRELFGDLEGAIELMSQAYQRTPPGETEDRAWLLTQVGHLQLLSGRTDEADTILAEALRIFPYYHYALAELAKVRTAQKRYDDAIELLQRRYDAAPHPENLYALAEACDRAGQHRKAGKLYHEFEKAALQESAGMDNANRELILYYADKARKAPEALRIAELELKRRPNIYIRDGYAWALYKNKRPTEARAELEKALAVGTRDPLLYEHARKIGLTTGKPLPSNNLTAF